MSTVELGKTASSRDEADERDYFLEKDSIPARIDDRSNRKEKLWKLPAIVSFVLLLLQTGLMVIWASRTSGADSYEKGFDTDLSM